MPYPPDPGGNFASDVHRRVAAILANLEPEGQPLTTDEVIARAGDDDSLNLGHDETDQVISELVAVGAAVTADGRHSLSEAGQNAFPASTAADGGPVFNA